MRKIQYDLVQQRILMAIGLMERITLDEPLDVQINIVKAFCNNTIKGGSDQTRRDDLLSAIKKVEQIAENLMISSDYLKAAAVDLQKKLEPVAKSAEPESYQLMKDN
jgi:hypothetical protein